MGWPSAPWGAAAREPGRRMAKRTQVISVVNTLGGLAPPQGQCGHRHAAVLFYSHHRSRCCCELSSFQSRSLRFGEEQ